MSFRTTLALALAAGVVAFVYLALDAILSALVIVAQFAAGVGLAILLYIAVLYWRREEHRRYRIIDGSLPIQRHRVNGHTIVVDPNKLPGAAYIVGPEVGYREIASSVDAQIQLLIDQAVQQTRSLAAIAPGDEALVRTRGMIDQPRINAGALGKLLPKPDRHSIPDPQSPNPPITQSPAPAPRLDPAQALAQSTGSRWLLGQADDGSLAAFHPAQHAHAAIVGSTGTGKTTSVGFGMALAALRSGWHVTILDPDGGANWQPFAPHAEWHETDRSAFPDQIAAIHHHYERRVQVANPRPCLIVIEEYGDLIRQLRATSRSDADAVDAMLDSILQRGRKRRVHICLIDQYPQHWSPAVIGGTKFRAVFQLGPNQGAKMEEYHAASLPDVGRFLLRGQQYDSWQMDAQLPALLRTLPAPDKPRRIINGTATAVRPDRSPERSVARSLPVPQEVAPPSPAPPNAANAQPGRTLDEQRQAIHDYLRSRPDASQADIRNALGTSKSYTHQCWHEWHNAQPTNQPANHTTIPDAIHGTRTIIDADDPTHAADLDAIRSAIAAGKISVG